MSIKSVLVVEDDRFIGEMYVRSLKAEGYEVNWVVDGHDGLVAATDLQYDLILLDIMLPELRGVEILDQIRPVGDDKVPGSKIIVLTNFDLDDATRRSVESRVDGYFIKADITPHTLIERIHALDSSQNSENPV